MLTMGRRRVRSLQWTAAPAQQPPFHQEERARDSRRGARSKAPPHGAWSKASPDVGPLLGRCCKAYPWQRTSGR